MSNDDAGGEVGGPVARISMEGLKGKTGDAGETGETGEAGRRGGIGLRGRRGLTGEAGAQGERGHPLHRGQALALAAFIVFAFGLLAVRSEIQANDLRAANRQAAVAQQAQCQISARNATALRLFLDQVSISVRNTPSLSPAEKARRVAAYEATKPRVPDCGPPLRP